MDWDKLEKDAYGYLGLTPHEMYEFTHNEYTNMMNGYQFKKEESLKEEQFNAWHVAAYVGMSFAGNELPTIADILTKPLFGDNKLSPPEDDTQLTEEQKFMKNRRKWMKVMILGIKVPDNILDEYSIKQ